MQRSKRSVLMQTRRDLASRSTANTTPLLHVRRAQRRIELLLKLRYRLLNDDVNCRWLEAFCNAF